MEQIYDLAKQKIKTLDNLLSKLWVEDDYKLEISNLKESDYFQEIYSSHHLPTTDELFKNIRVNIGENKRHSFYANLISIELMININKKMSNPNDINQELFKNLGDGLKKMYKTEEELLSIYNSYALNSEYQPFPGLWFLWAIDLCIYGQNEKKLDESNTFFNLGVRYFIHNQPKKGTYFFKKAIGENPLKAKQLIRNYFSNSQNSSSVTKISSNKNINYLQQIKELDHLALATALTDDNFDSLINIRKEIEKNTNQYRLNSSSNLTYINEMLEDGDNVNNYSQNPDFLVKIISNELLAKLPQTQQIDNDEFKLGLKLIYKDSETIAQIYDTYAKISKNTDLPGLWHMWAFYVSEYAKNESPIIFAKNYIDMGIEHFHRGELKEGEYYFQTALQLHEKIAKPLIKEYFS